jgi:Skp family chaperone for outer membrane proteins
LVLPGSAYAQQTRPSIGAQPARPSAGSVPARNLTVALAPSNEAPEKRIALIIGNSSYSKKDPLPQLKNPSNDASDIAATLKQFGFSDVRLVVNATRRDMMEAINAFGETLHKSSPNAVGLFYYAGHGVQNNGRNYLIPIGADVPSPSQLEHEALDAQRVLSFMEEAGNRINIVILDACRDNPFPSLSRFRSAGASSAGLAQMKAAKGSFIAFAAAEGQKASDGNGRNGLFTQHFLASLKQPDTNIDTVFQRVTRGVAEATGDQQIPWRNSSLTSAFYFRPVEIASLGSSAGMTSVNPAAFELMFWDSVKNSTNAADFDAYLTSFPQGQFAALARNAKNKLENGSKERDEEMQRLAAARAREEAQKALEERFNEERRQQQAKLDQERQQQALQMEEERRKNREQEQRLQTERAAREAAFARQQAAAEQRLREEENRRRAIYVPPTF